MKPPSYQRCSCFSVLMSVVAVVSFCQGAGAAPDIVPPELQGNFTLTYQVVRHDLRTAAMQAQERQAVTQSYQAAVQQGKMSQPEASARLKGLHPAPKTQTWQVSISSDGHKLLFVRDVSQGSRAEAIRVLYDGKDTYEFHPLVKQLNIRSGLHIEGMQGCPFPGTGLPYLPLLKSLNIQSQQRSVSQSHVFVAGRITANADVIIPGGTLIPYVPAKLLMFQMPAPQPPLIRMISALAGGRRVAAWEYQQFRPFRERQIASSFRYTTALSPYSSAPDTMYDYTLKQARDTPLQEELFDPERWVTPQSLVEDGRQDKAVAYVYKPSAGSLSDQSERQQIIRGLHNAHSSRRAGAPSAGVFVLALLLLGGAWFTWKRRTSK